ncbi:DUF2807 domain-containing protein [Massilia sp. YIM B02763]|uniref:GIN domain-containing protein n=1 Tax=Massilia sp. YIM B02763 TaxID=3050130 RepID=UPI0025B665AD|nr:DUF2807 domain-containing protein [Massilia sp. YIM B02763]MDN4054437.1 DUF2807 domain-containing protein [Massilia sp. YIM B02763]
MNKMLSLGLVFAGLCAFFGIARGADNVTETRTVDARIVRVKFDGAIDLRIRQGGTPALTLVGDADWLPRISTVQDGDTLSIDTQGRGRVRLGTMRVDLVLPALREVVSEGLGATEVSGFSGEELALTLDGAGSMKVACNYRVVTANLGGIGSMNLQGLSGEGVALNLGGAGTVRLSGRAKWLKADLGGLGSLDAQQFNADNVNIDLSGLGNASVTAHQNANLNLSGMGSVTVYGKPLNRKVAVDGLGKVSWK